MPPEPNSTSRPIRQPRKVLLVGKWEVILFTLIVALGMVSVASAVGSYGYAFAVVMPFSIGFLYVCHSEMNRVSAMIHLLAILSICGSVIYSVGEAGSLCICMTMAVFFVPISLGILVGKVWRASRLNSRKDLPLALIVATIGGLGVEPILTGPHAPETVTTARILPMSRSDAWKAIVFYEDVDAPPPLLARIGLPRPLRTSGRPDEVRARTQCEYTTGRIEKLVTQLSKEEFLAFDVTEQVGVEDHSVKLLSGSFTFEDAPGGTLVTLRTTYQPLLDARLAWRWLERAVCRDLHLHVLGAMQRQGALLRHSKPTMWASFSARLTE